jgi:hypothetical protein
MTHVPPRRLLLACLALLHFLAAPCVMALAAEAEAPCDHCAAGDSMACTSGPAGAVQVDAAVAPGKSRPPAFPAGGPVTVLAQRGGSLEAQVTHAAPAARVGLATGRHSGDPPVAILLGRFLI